MEKLERIAEDEEFIVDLESLEPDKKRTPYQRVKDAFTNYLVDVSAGLIFYNPLMIVNELFVGGMTQPEILKSRIGASIMQAITMRPTGMIRNASAAYFGLTKESPWYKKGLSDVASIWALQIPAYSASLVYALANSEGSLEKGLKSLLTGLAVTGITNNGTKIGFGKWMDFWRGIWGKKKAIK